jgi:hypothetical protein
VPIKDFPFSAKEEKKTREQKKMFGPDFSASIRNVVLGRAPPGGNFFRCFLSEIILL